MRGSSALIAVAFLGLASCSSEAVSRAAEGPKAQAIFAGGCFWCTEADFDKMPGVISTTSGYSGGRTQNPTYKQVSAGGTGHIEVVRVVYDPRRTNYSQLVQRFLRTIDVTDSGGQFCDRGDSYRPALFASNPAEKQAAQQALASAAKELRKKVTVEVLPAARFFPAEGYHQDYYKKNPARYKFYRWNCGRDQKLRQLWG